jgi:hypothetical protein
MGLLRFEPNDKGEMLLNSEGDWFLADDVWEELTANRDQITALRAQLAEAREAARVLMHAALTRTSIVSLEQIQAAIDTVEKWEG